MTTGFVYILRPRAQVQGREVIKIGMTTRSIRQRVKELSTGSPFGFDVRYSIRADNAREFERTLHKRYERFRVTGGGQEFFAVSSEIVISDIEKIALEVSKERARAVRDAELALYKRAIGARSAELKLIVPLVALFPLTWAATYYYLVAPFFNREHEYLSLAAAFVGIYVVPIIIWKSGSRIYSFLHRQFILPRFSEQLALKEQELRIEYPLAYA